MRVGIDYLPALTDVGGRGRYVRELVRAMGDLGFATNLGLFGYGFPSARWSRQELGLDELRAELVRLRWPRTRLPWLLGRLSKGVDDLVGGCDVYHHTLPEPLAVRMAIEVVTIGDCLDGLDAGHPEDAGYASPALARRRHAGWRSLIERARRVIVPSEYVGAEVVMSFGVNPGRVVVTHLGCDHVVRHLPPAGFEAAPEPYVLTVGRIESRKNHLRMLQAFELLCREGLPQRWIVVGEPGHGSKDWRKALAQSSVRARVDWRRSVSERELIELYARADAFVWTSLNEGFGLPPLEAMACGTPVVSSHVTAIPEVCADAAFLVEPTEPERIFEATRRLLSEPELARDLVERGRRRAREFTWRECAKSTLLAYQAAQDASADEPRMQGLF